MDNTGKKQTHEPLAEHKVEPATSERVKPDEVIYLPDLSGDGG